jgi:hypothetical protein
MRSRFGRFAFLRWACFACLISTTSLLAQDRAAQERGREQWQNVDVIFAEMGVRPGQRSPTSEPATASSQAVWRAR